VVETETGAGDVLYPMDSTHTIRFRWLHGALADATHQLGNLRFSRSGPHAWRPAINAYRCEGCIRICVKTNMKTKAKFFGIMIATAGSFVASTSILAQEAKSDSAPASSSDNARLVVSRAANFGILESVNVFVDGVQVAELELSQSYDAVLPPGQHLL